MDKDPGPECRIYAVIELGSGIAEMKITEVENNNIRIVDRLWHRMPFELLHTKSSGSDAALEAVRNVLRGFINAARDYAVCKTYMIIANVDTWRDDLICIAKETGAVVVAPDERRYADMVIASACSALDDADERRLFIMFGSKYTYVVSDDGKYFLRLPMGADKGQVCGLLNLARNEKRSRLKSGEKRSTRNALLRDEAYACAQLLPAGQMRDYKLFVCVSGLNKTIAEGKYPAKQFSRMVSDMARRSQKAGVQLCYAIDESDISGESFDRFCTRREYGTLALADAICTRLGATEVTITYADAANAVARSLTKSGASPDDAGANFNLAMRGVTSHANAHGADPDQCARISALSRMILTVMNRAFDKDELPAAYELIQLSAALKGCVLPNQKQIINDIDMLPGLNAQMREMLKEMCSLDTAATNEAIIGMNAADDAALPDENNTEEMFSGDQSDDDEFATDEYDTDAIYSDGDDANDENSTNDKDDSTEQPRHMSLELRTMSILYIAHALNASGRARLQGFTAKLTGRGLVLRATEYENAVLETMSFKYRAKLFEQVFGLKIHLKTDKHRPTVKQTMA